MKKAKYEEVMCCPECGWNKGLDRDRDGMPDQYDWSYGTDKNGKEYVECYCGCKFMR